MQGKPLSIIIQVDYGTFPWALGWVVCILWAKPAHLLDWSLGWSSIPYWIHHSPCLILKGGEPDFSACWVTLVWVFYIDTWRVSIVYAYRIFRKLGYLSNTCLVEHFSLILRPRGACEESLCCFPQALAASVSLFLKHQCTFTTFTRYRDKCMKGNRSDLFIFNEKHNHQQSQVCVVWQWHPLFVIIF